MYEDIASFLTANPEWIGTRDELEKDTSSWVIDQLLINKEMFFYDAKDGEPIRFSASPSTPESIEKQAGAHDASQ